MAPATNTARTHTTETVLNLARHAPQIPDFAIQIRVNIEDQSEPGR
jgi:hypothetical protein